MKIIALTISLIGFATATLHGMKPGKSTTITFPEEIMNHEIYSHLLGSTDLTKALKLSRLFTLTKKKFQSPIESFLKGFMTARTLVNNEHPIAVALKIYKIMQGAQDNSFLKIFKKNLKETTQQRVANFLFTYLEKYVKDKDSVPELKKAVAQRDFSQIDRAFRILNDQLIESANAGDTARLEELIEDGHVDHNAQSSLGYTILMIAILKDDLPLMRAILGIPLNLNTADILGNTALIHAVRGKKSDLVKKLLALGVDVNAHNHTGQTAFLCAAQMGYYSIAQDLIESGADVNAQEINIFGDKHYTATALYEAVVQNNKTLVKLLLDAGAQVTTHHDFGDTPLHYAVALSSEISLLLLEAGADVNAQNDLGDTALLETTSRFNLNLVRTLLMYKADVNVRNQRGETALTHIARQAYHDPVQALQIIRKLVQSGADVNVQDGNGKTALSYTKDTPGLEEIAEFLRLSGATDRTCTIQ